MFVSELLQGQGCEIEVEKWEKGRAEVCEVGMLRCSTALVVGFCAELGSLASSGDGVRAAGSARSTRNEDRGQVGVLGDCPFNRASSEMASSGTALRRRITMVRETSSVARETL